MWKISIVMLVTAIFAGLLIQQPYELHSRRVAVAIDTPHRAANLVSTFSQAEAAPAVEVQPLTQAEAAPAVEVQPLTQAKAVPAVEVPPSTQAEAAPAVEVPPSTQAKAVMWPQEDVSSQILEALPDKPVPSAALEPLRALNRFHKRPVPPSIASTPGIQPLFVKRKIFHAEDARDFDGRRPARWKENARDFEGRRREARWIENARDSSRPQHSRRQPTCSSCH